MRSIDVHAHITPQVLFRAVDSGADWHTIRLEKNRQGHETVVAGPQRAQVHPKSRFTPELRITDMDSLGVDVQVLSTHSALYNYHLDTQVAAATSKEANDEVSEMVKPGPAGLQVWLPCRCRMWGPPLTNWSAAWFSLD